MFIPYPSTNKYKPRKKQLPFVLVEHICSRNKNFINGSGVIFRQTNIKKNTRNKSKQLKSLSVRDPYASIKGSNVVVLDDVTTTGSSLKAGIELIKKHKPLKVIGFAAAKKVYLKDIPIGSKY